MTHSFPRRIFEFQSTLTDSQIVCISNPADIAYFTGFFTLVAEEREAYLIVTSQQAILFHTAFSSVTHWPGIEYQPTASLEKVTTALTQIKSDILQKNTVRNCELLLDYTSLFVAEFKAFEKIHSLQLMPLSRDAIWQLRMLKDEFEQTALQKAASVTRDTYTFIQDLFKVGITEQELAWAMERYIREKGGRLAFPTIVAFGAHAALPHHQPTMTKLTMETAVLIDFGAKIDGYCSDTTRTVWFGQHPTPEFLEIETIIHQAYDAALAVCTKCISSPQTEDTKHSPNSNEDLKIAIGEIDAAARAVIEKSGYGKSFIHTTGHGLGIEIHEQPSIYKTTATPLQQGLAITIEPGIYLPGKLGYRYENTLLLLPEKVIELTR